MLLKSFYVQDKLEWSRSVDAGKLDQLRQMMSDPNYKENLPSLIRPEMETGLIICDH